MSTPNDHEKTGSEQETTPVPSAWKSETRYTPFTQNEHPLSDSDVVNLVNGEDS